LTVIGARPQFIKSTVVSEELQKSGIEEVCVHTGQHYDENMSGIFFDQLNMKKPDVQLEIGSGAHGFQTGRMLIEIESIFNQKKPDGCIVYGDTNSTLAGALVASKLHIPIYHIEAGLRSFNKKMPEEINRVLTDHISEILFTPTEIATNNLLKEGFEPGKIFEVGDVMLDSSLQFKTKIQNINRTLDTYGLQSEKYVLVTLHRPSNVDSKKTLLSLLSALDRVGNDLKILFPVHPRTSSKMLEFKIDQSMFKNIKFVDPLGYLDMIALESQAKMIITDSGGVQKEAFFYRVPCVTLRNETEWVELVDSEWNFLLSPEGSIDELYESIVGRVGHKGKNCELYGSGDASKKIVSIIKSKAKS
jgi:UDP-GlcNAc3NAcA epimerase